MISIKLVLFTPKGFVGKAPACLLINHLGYNNMGPTRNNKTDFWPAEMVIDSNIAIAAFHVSDVAPDDKLGGWADKLLQMYPEQLDKPKGMKALAAWA